MACNLGKPDKCVGVRSAFGAIRGCGAALCLDGLDGVAIEGCGSGSRVGRAVIDLAGGGELAVVGVHGTSGISDADVACRVAQLDAVFSDAGDGSPLAAGRAVVLGDFNTDPVRMAWFDASAARLAELVGPKRPYDFVNDVGEDSLPTYGGVAIDHVIATSGALGSCISAGNTPGTHPPTDVVYFDHRPLRCDLSLPAD